jgi:non-ribosomal peptide synthetase component E (peptide arylation enzyme)
VGLHPAERVREYRDKGYWTDDMIDALLRDRVRQFGDITAITDPLNREALLDGLPERLEIRQELPRNPLGKILKRELRDELRQ